MKVLQIIFVALLSAVAVTIAYKSGGNWFVMGSTTANFSTADPSTQSCSSLTENQSCIITWTVNATGGPGSYELFINFSNSSLNKYFNGTIFDKGNNSNVIPNYSCTGCAFKIVPGTNTDMRNPLTIGNLTNNGTIIAWNVSASGPINSTWDLFAIVTYNSTTGTQKDTNITKIRVVDYPWWNTSWNCRQLINVTQNTGSSGTGVVEINSISFDTTAGSCGLINCTKQIRVTEVLPDKSQIYVLYLLVNETQYIILDPKYCDFPNIKFNATLSSSQTKQFFIYYNNPIIVEDDYLKPNLSSPVIASYSYSDLVKQPQEKSWDLFYDSHIDIWWTNASDQQCDPICPSGSHRFRDNGNDTFLVLKGLNYNPQTYANRDASNILQKLPSDLVYTFYGHGSLFKDTDIGSSGLNQTSINPSYGRFLFSSNISNLTQSLSAKLVISISSFGGDNSTSLNGCPLNNWLSKAFTEKGADCYLGFLGSNVSTLCTNCNCGGDSDVYHHDTRTFMQCFLGNITQGDTIRQAINDAKSCSVPDVNPILVNSTPTGCDIPLIK